MAALLRPLLRSRILCTELQSPVALKAQYSTSTTSTDAGTATESIAAASESVIQPGTANGTSRPAPTEPYFVGRTKSNNLPVYRQAKRGGNLQQTKIQKIEGNTSILRKQLQTDLGLGEKDVVINPVTNHIIIKGWKQQEVLEFLGKRNF